MEDAANWFHVFDSTNGLWLQDDEKSWGSYRDAAEFATRDLAHEVRQGGGPVMSHAALAEIAATHARYFRLRTEHPLARPSTCIAYARGEYDGGESGFEQFRCGRERGHRFQCTGVAYGGDDESYHGEGRCLCVHCGADGDA